jgi:hypothetical protein
MTLTYQKETPSGPFQAAYRRLRKHKGIVQGLNALHVRTGHSIPDLVLRICLMRFVPELDITLLWPEGRCPEAAIPTLMTRLRGLKAQESIPIGQGIENACTDYLMLKLVSIDRYGSAILPEDIAVIRQRGPRDESEQQLLAFADLHEQNAVRQVEDAARPMPPAPLTPPSVL